jgi:hypothetical protein
MSKRKEFREIEKQLNDKFINLKENEVILREHDFENGKLTKSGYINLKQQSDYVSVHEDIIIRIPKVNVADFKDQLEYMATKELVRIKTDMRDANIFALTFFILGIILLSLPALIDFFKTQIVNEILLITSWFFVWAAVEKRFFEMSRLKNHRKNLLHILTSQISTYHHEQDIIDETILINEGDDDNGQ